MGACVVSLLSLSFILLINSHISLATQLSSLVAKELASIAQKKARLRPVPKNLIPGTDREILKFFQLRSPY